MSASAGGPPGLPWVQQWVKATTWWADPARLTELAGNVRRSQERVLLDLAEGVLAQFTGRRLTVERRGQVVRLVLDSLRIEGSVLAGTPLPVPGRGAEDDVTVRVEASDVEWAGGRFDTVTVVAEQVRLVAGLPARLSASVLDVTVGARTAGLLPWVRRAAGPAWELAPAGGTAVTARRVSGTTRLLVEPAVADGMVHLDIRRVEWRGLRVTIPRWIRLVRRHPVPALPPGVELVATWREGETLRARFRVDGPSAAVSLDQAHRAIERDDPSFSVDRPPSP